MMRLSYFSSHLRYSILAFFVMLFVPCFGMTSNPSEIQEDQVFITNDILAEGVIVVITAMPTSTIIKLQIDQRIYDASSVATVNNASFNPKPFNSNAVCWGSFFCHSSIRSETLSHNAAQRNYPG